MTSSKVALVTGGTGGLGSAICQAYAELGFNVAFTYRSSQKKADELFPGLSGSGHRSYHVDLNESAQIDQLGHKLAADLGRLDVLVNCAGTTRFVDHDDLAGIDDALFDLIMRTNVRAPFAVVRTFRSMLAEQGGGVVINISSIAARTGMGSNIAYCASKAAVDNMTKSLARALAPDIRVISVAPGLVDTEFVKGLNQGWRQEQMERTPLKRLASPEEVARVVVAASEDLTFSTGCIIAVDGGRPLA